MCRKKSYTCVALAAIFFATTSAVAEQTWVVRTWQSDEGLPDNTVMAIDQTPDGFLWVATKTGLVRFDGVQFREFSTQAPGMAVDAICAMCADRKGRIWVAKDRGSVVCVDQGRVTEIVGDVSGGSDLVDARMLVVDHEDAVWVARKSGEPLRIKDGKVRAYTTADGLPAGGVFELAVDPSGRVWFLGDMLGFIREEKVTVLAKAPSFERICGAREGGVRLLSETAVATYTEGKGFSGQLDWKTGISAYAGPTVLLEDRTGRVWAGTRAAGLFCIDGNQAVEVRTSQKTMLCLKEDAEGNIWVGTRGGGLKQIRPRVAALRTTGSATQLDGTQSLCKDTQGHLWAVIWHTCVIVRNTGHGWEPLTARDGWSETTVNCVAADPAGGVWIGTTGNGVFHWQDGAVSRHFSSTNGLTGGAIDALYATESGELWFSSPDANAPNGTLFCYKDGAFRSFPLPVGAGRVKVFAGDGAGDCWAGTANGWLLRVRGDVLADETPLLLSDTLYPIRSLLATPDRSLWIGFAGRGLGRLKDGRFTSFRREQGLHDDYVSQILCDGRGRLWLAGNRGISSVRIKDLDERTAGRDNQIHALVYKQKDGLLALQASYNTSPNAFRDKDGALFFAMQSGVATLYPDAITDDPLPPKVVIDRVLATGEVVALYGASGETLPGTNVASLVELGQAGAELHLPSGRRQVEFRFTAPAFTMQESIRFKYQLQGLDQEWIEAGAHRSVLYSQLAPGHYTFQVIACNRDGVWNEQGASLDVMVPPFWWETTWFRVGGTLCTFGVVGCFVVLWLRWRHQIKIEKLKLQQAIEHVRVRIAQDLHDDLGAGLTEVALLSEVVRLNLDTPDVAEMNVRRIFASSREMTQALDEIVWSVNPANDTLEKLVSFVCEFSQAFLSSAGILCEMDVPAVVPDLEVNAQIRHQICMMVKECLANVIKHARAKTVTLTLRLEGRSLEIKVEDDGVGFDPARVKDTTGTHDGLANLKQRLTVMNGTCELQSVRGQGTRIRLVVGL